MSRACSRWKKTPFSFVFATTYSVPALGSITGVPVMPICGTRSVHSMSLTLSTVVTDGGLMKLTCHSGLALAPAALSASNAYTLSFSVATNTTLWVCPPIETFGTYNVCA